jgi:peptidoglycan/LPS O-acetylase OafA/YrhL
MTNCIEQLTCFPSTNPLEFFTFWNKVYGIPNAVILGLFLGLIIGAIYLKTRSLIHLAILGIYAISIVSATWASETIIAPAYQTVLYIIAVAIASLLVVIVLKSARE